MHSQLPNQHVGTSHTVATLLEKRFVLFAAGLLILLAVVQYQSIHLESLITDERPHITAGYVYLSLGEFWMNTEHPPLAQMWAALPLLALNPDVAVHSAEWLARDQWGFSYLFMYQNRVPERRLLLRARYMMIVVTLVLATVVAWWTKRRFGAAAALLALGLISLDPNIIAHGRYATLDVMVSLFFFLTLALWMDYLEKGGWVRLLGTAASFGLAVGSKHSALILIPILVLLYLLYASRKGRLRVGHATASLAAVFLGGVIILAALYFPEIIRVLKGEQTQLSYIGGLQNLQTHNGEGHSAYLMGEFSSGGWWSYFPIAFAVKTPTGVLLLLAGLAVIELSRWRKRTDRLGIPVVVIGLLIACGIYFGVALTGRINIGLRHILPIYPLLYIVLAAVALRSKSGARLAVLALLLVAVESLAAYPNYLGFFNTPSGGMDHGAEFLLDSNIDWGQDAKKLRRYIVEQGDPPMCVAYFGAADLNAYDISAKPLPPMAPQDPAELDCMAAVSVNFLYGLFLEEGAFEWLRKRRPLTRIGSSIYIFDLRRTADSH